MLQESLDFRAEVGELHDFAKGLAAEDWEKPTGFKQWTPWDVVAHLHFFDLVSLGSVQGEEAFAEVQSSFLGAVTEGKSNTEIARNHFGPISPEELMERWQRTCHELTEQLGSSDPKRRLPWFGPDMGVRMFTTARYMETWAHGQALYDLAGAARPQSDRIRNIAVIGVKTFGWTYVNRKLPVPPQAPHVKLTAPSGAVWEWNEPDEENCVRGSAVDFCQTVTQVRNVADTQLEVVGETATHWMSIAQCFAGPPEEPPAPGSRVVG